MTKWEIFQLAMKLAPSVAQLVATVEATIDPATPGPAKLEAIKHALVASASAAGVADPAAIEAAWPVVEALTGSLLATFRQHGTASGAFSPQK